MRGRRRRRRVLWWSIGVLSLFAAVASLAALGVGPEARLDHADRLASVGGLLASLASLVVAIYNLLSQRRSADPVAVNLKALGWLAGRLREQVNREAALRGLSTPEPLPLRWLPTPRPVSVSTADLLGDSDGGRARLSVRLSRPRRGGDVTELATLWRRLPGRQLVLIGVPGAGKTSAAVLFTRRLLADRDPGNPKDPVPVLVSLTSWNPRRHGLYQWLADRLTALDGRLADEHPDGDRTIAEVLLRDSLVVPVLDGLDELPESLHAPALTAISQAVGADRPLVLTCRADEYQAAVAAGLAAPARAPAVEIAPVDGDQVARYLVAGLPEPARRRWDPVRAALRRHRRGPLASALSTPLMVYLARTVYTHPDTDPVELLGLDTARAIEAHLLRGYLPALYRSPPIGPDAGPGQPTLRPYRLTDARRWLRFLAERQDRDGEDLAWWRLSAAIGHHALVARTVFVAPAAAAVVYAVTVSDVIDPRAVFETVLAGASFGGAAFVFMAVLLGVLGVLGSSADEPFFAFRWWARWPIVRRFLDGAAFGVLGATAFVLWWTFLAAAVYLAAPAMVLAVAAVLVFKERDDLPRQIRVDLGLMAPAVPIGVIAGLGTALYLGRAAGLAAGLVMGLASTLVGGLTGSVTRADLLDPVGTLRRDRTQTVACLVASGLLGLLAGALTGLLPGVLVASALAVGFLDRSRWANYHLARVRLAARGRLPWRLMAFLADAHQRGVLRQVGAEYGFRHIRIQEHLAPPQSPPTPSPDGADDNSSTTDTTSPDRAAEESGGGE